MHDNSLLSIKAFPQYLYRLKLDKGWKRKVKYAIL